jgi:hypothetical protein
MTNTHNGLGVRGMLRILRKEKFYTRTRIRVSQLAKIPTLFPD